MTYYLTDEGKEYHELKFRILTKCQNSIKLDDLQRLKMMYSIQIDSPRRLYYISTLIELITILEKRGFANMTLLYNIANQLGRPDLVINPCDSKLSVHTAIGKASAQMANNNQSQNDFKQHARSKNSTTDLQKAYEIIARDIGRKWKDMARGLNVKENEIDEITIRYNNDIKSQVFAVFRLFEERQDERDLKYVLCNALDRARRKDLRLSIEKVMLVQST